MDDLDIIDCISDNPTKDDLDAIYNSFEEIRREISEQIIPLLSKKINRNRKEQAVLELYSRMKMWFETIILMNNLHCVQAISAACRAMFELFIDLKIIANDKTEISLDQYFTFPEIELYNYAEKSINFYKRYPGKQCDETVVNFYNEKGRRERVFNTINNLWPQLLRKEELIYPKNWRNKDVRARTKELGFEYEEQYIDLYTKMNWLIHSSPTAYQKLNAFTNIILIIYAYNQIQTMFIDATIICAEVFNISEYDESIKDKIYLLNSIRFQNMINMKKERTKPNTNTTNTSG